VETLHQRWSCRSGPRYLRAVRAPTQHEGCANSNVAGELGLRTDHVLGSMTPLESRRPSVVLANRLPRVVGLDRLVRTGALLQLLWWGGLGVRGGRLSRCDLASLIPRPSPAPRLPASAFRRRSSRWRSASTCDWRCPIATSKSCSPSAVSRSTTSPFPLGDAVHAAVGRGGPALPAPSRGSLAGGRDLCEGRRPLAICVPRDRSGRADHRPVRVITAGPQRAGSSSGPSAQRRRDRWRS
jgi:hypothetical protein